MDTLRSSLKSMSLKGKTGDKSKLDSDFAPATAPAPEPLDTEPAPLGPPVRLAVIGAGQRGSASQVPSVPANVGV